jgi:hypothetical protein
VLLRRVSDKTTWRERRHIPSRHLAESSDRKFVESLTTKLERLRQERQQVTTLLANAHLLAETRKVLEALATDLDLQIDRELTAVLSPHSATKAAD